MKTMPMGGGGEIIRGVGALGNREDHTTTEYHRMPHNVIRVYPAMQHTWVYQGMQYTMYRYTGEYDTGIHGETARTTPRLRRQVLLCLGVAGRLIYIKNFFFTLSYIIDNN